jgi:hypothetical protein
VRTSSRRRRPRWGCVRSPARRATRH